MNRRRGGSYDRKLEAVLVARLERGADPRALLEELKTRLDGQAADAILSRADARLARTRQAPRARLVRIFAVIAYAWTAFLILQNLFILTTVAQFSPTYGLGALVPQLIALPLLKIGALCAGIFVFKAWRSAATAAVCALAILFAFPFGLYANALLMRDVGGPGPDEFLSVSALCSYAAAVLVGAAWWLGRRPAKPAVGAEVFD